MLYTVLFYIVRTLLEDNSAFASDFLAAFDHMRFAGHAHQKLLFVGFLNRRGYRLKKLELMDEECKVAFDVEGIDVVIFINSDYVVDCVMVDKYGHIVFSDINTI